MTNTDDWTRFVEMMEDAGWHLRKDQHYFYRLNNGNQYHYATGKSIVGTSRQFIGDWRTWLEAGSTPSPF